MKHYVYRLDAEYVSLDAPDDYVPPIAITLLDYDGHRARFELVHQDDANA